MNDLIRINVELVLAIHKRQLAEHGGLEGVRDQGMLESALARPRQQFAYSNPTTEVPALAAAYAFGVTRNHPFFDGNKRTAYVVCRTFLVLNGFDLTATLQERYLTFLTLAAGEVSKEGFVDWVIRNTSRG